jgi:hypothetical protein
MENKQQLDKKWYDNKFVTNLLLIIFFPVGLYALWKSRTIAKWWKVTATVLIGLIVITNLNSSNDSSSNDVNSRNSNNNVNNENESQIKLTQAEKDSINEIDRIENERVQKSRAEKEQIIEKLKTKAKRDWPNDYTTQEFWVNQQIEDYEYMLTIEGNSIKERAQRDWPLDFSTQKFWYNEQIEARERMK